MKSKKYDVVIVGTGASGLYAAIHLPSSFQVCLITKSKAEYSDSFLAQGGICVQRDDSDSASFFEDTMKAGHYKNNPNAVQVMIESSMEVIAHLRQIGVRFASENGHLLYTREGAHSVPRILYHKDMTGKEITSHLLKEAGRRANITLMEYTEMTDLYVENGVCKGIYAKKLPKEEMILLLSRNTVLATGGIGGQYEHSTNYRHLTGDGIEAARKHHVFLKDMDYVQIHPTTLYSKRPGRRFLISESVRGEGAVLLDKKGQRFVNELQPRDVVTAAILKQMQIDQTPHVWLSLEQIEKETLLSHFPTIYDYCLEEGYDITREWIPVVPAQHYLMGGIDVDLNSQTSMAHLYAVGETACNGVHGANRLASNSLLESLVFARRAALQIQTEERNTVSVPYTYRKLESRYLLQ